MYYEFYFVIYKNDSSVLQFFNVSLNNSIL